MSYYGINVESLYKPIYRSLSDKIQETCLYPDGEHHELSSGRHGRKLEMDKIEPDTSLFYELLEATAEKIDKIAGGRPLGRIALIGVESGANRYIKPLADRLGPAVIPLFTAKTDDKRVVMTNKTVNSLKTEKPQSTIFLDDVGTTGGTTSKLVMEVQGIVTRRPKVVYLVSRKLFLPSLEAADIDYHSVTDVLLNDFSPEECAIDPDGYCHQGMKLIRHRQ